MISVKRMQEISDRLYIRLCQFHKFNITREGAGETNVNYIRLIKIGVVSYNN